MEFREKAAQLPSSYPPKQQRSVEKTVDQQRTETRSEGTESKTSDVNQAERKAVRGRRERRRSSDEKGSLRARHDNKEDCSHPWEAKVPEEQQQQQQQRKEMRNGGAGREGGTVSAPAGVKLLVRRRAKRPVMMCQVGSWSQSSGRGATGAAMAAVRWLRCDATSDVRAALRDRGPGLGDGEG